MRAYSLGGTSPRNTRVSVPRLMALCSARTQTSSALGRGRVSLRSSACPGRVSQRAWAVNTSSIALASARFADQLLHAGLHVGGQGLRAARGVTRVAAQGLAETH